MNKAITLLTTCVVFTVCFAFAGSRLMQRDVDPGDGAVTLTEVTSGRNPADILAAHRYVSRGDLGSWDFNKSDLEIDNAWHDLSLTSEIPIGVSIVLIVINADVDTEKMEVLIRKNGVTGGVNRRRFSPLRTNFVEQTEMFVSVDTNSIVEYKATTNGTWTVLRFAILGYFLGE